MSDYGSRIDIRLPGTPNGVVMIHFPHLPPSDPVWNALGANGVTPDRERLYEFDRDFRNLVGYIRDRVIDLPFGASERKIAALIDGPGNTEPDDLNGPEDW